MTPKTHHTSSRLLRGVSAQAIGWAVALAAGAAAHAETAPAAAPAAEPTEVITVTGIRGGIARSIHTKRINTSVVEAVSAEDIGKLPDTSIAESIARLPGLTAQRLDGRDQVVSIRGFGPDFSTALLNGREQVTTGNNRGVEYDQYPSELISSVVVAKTADAATIGQGMVGTVQLNTLRPLDQSGRLLSLQARAEMDGKASLNPDSPRAGYRFSGLYADKFANDTVGVMLGVAIQSSPVQCQCYNAWGFPSDSSGNLILGGSKSYGESHVVDRQSGVFTVEYEPNENFHSTFDAFYSHFVDKDHLRGIEFPLAWSGASVGPSTVANGMDTVTTFSNVHAVQRNDFNQRNAHTFSLGWNNKFKITDKIKANFDLSWSRAVRKDFLAENYTGTGYNQTGPGDTVTVTRQPSGWYKISEALNYADTSLFKITDPQGWGGNYLGNPVVQAGYLNQPAFTDDLKAVRLDFDGELDKGIFKSWEIGANISRRQKASNFTAFFLTPPGGATSAAIPQGAVIGNGSATPLAWLGVGPTIALDPLYLYSHVYSPLADLRPVSLTDDYLVRETVEVGYAKLNIDGHIGSVPVKGNIGAQVVHTRQFSTGISASIAPTTPPSVLTANISGSDDYTRFLPSMNLNFEVTPDFQIRFGASRTLARPRLDQEEITSTITTNLTYLTSTNPSQAYFGGTGGNIHLHPYIADGVDLTLEKYFGSGGLISVQGYYKHLTDFVNPNLSTIVDFTAAIPTFLTPAQAAQLGTPLGAVGAPANSGKGDILGLEFLADVPFKVISPVLDGFGIQFSAAYTDSRVKYEPTDTSYLPIEGLSKFVDNVTGYYEKNGFQVRISARHRSSYLAEVSGLSASRVFRNGAGETIVDAQIGYKFQSGPLKNLEILLQGKNLTDSAFVTYANKDPRQVIDYQTYGPTFLMGASYKF